MPTEAAWPGSQRTALAAGTLLAVGLAAGSFLASPYSEDDGALSKLLGYSLDKWSVSIWVALVVTALTALGTLLARRQEQGLGTLLTSFGRHGWPALFYMWGLQTVMGLVGVPFGIPQLRVYGFAAVYVGAFVVGCQCVVLLLLYGSTGPVMWLRGPLSWSLRLTALAVIGNLGLLFGLFAWWRWAHNLP